MRTDSLRGIPLLLVLALAACDVGSSAPADMAYSRGAERCANVSHSGAASLGFPVVIPPPPGEAAPIVGAGALPAAATLGPFGGLLSSVITSESQSGGGAVHYRLAHYFVTPAGDAFWTRDRAVCAPAGGGALTCRVNDVMEVVAGAGAFANAGGSLRNHGLITITDPSGNPFGTLSVDIRGRLCGDGL